MHGCSGCCCSFFEHVKNLFEIHHTIKYKIKKEKGKREEKRKKKKN